MLHVYARLTYLSSEVCEAYVVFFAGASDGRIGGGGLRAEGSFGRGAWLEGVRARGVEGKGAGGIVWAGDGGEDAG